MRVFGTRLGVAHSPFPLSSAHGGGRSWWHSRKKHPLPMGGMSSLSSADAAAASTEPTDGDAQQLLDRIHATLMAAFQRHARDGGGLRALSMDDIAPLRTLCDQLLPAHCAFEFWCGVWCYMTSMAERKTHLSCCLIVRNPVPVKLQVPEPATNRSPRGRRNRVRYQHISGNHLFSMG
jgi:hypothetical protein